MHHCDERLPKSELEVLFPSFDFPASMPEEDTVWRPKSVRGRETEDEMVARAGRGLAILMDHLRDEDRCECAELDRSSRATPRSMCSADLLTPRRLLDGPLWTFARSVQELWGAPSTPHDG